MTKDTRTRAQRNKAVRQEALREQLSKQKLVEKVIDSIEKIDNAAGTMESAEIQAHKLVIDTRLKLIDKYLPSLKSVDIEGDIEHSGSLSITWQK